MPTLDRDRADIDKMIETSPRVVLALGRMHEGLVHECREYSQQLSNPDLSIEERRKVEGKMQRMANFAQKKLGYPYRQFDDVMQRAEARVEMLDKKPSNDSVSN